MAWTCPTCQRTFTLENQWHSCYQGSIDAHFEKAEPTLRQVFDELLSIASSFGADVTVDPVKTSIMLRRGSSFLGVQVRRKALLLSFQLDVEHSEFPIAKTQQLSTNRWLHLLEIDALRDLDDQLISWLKTAYQLSAPKTRKQA